MKIDLTKIVDKDLVEEIHRRYYDEPYTVLNKFYNDLRAKKLKDIDKRLNLLETNHLKELKDRLEQVEQRLDRIYDKTT